MNSSNKLHNHLRTGLKNIEYVKHTFQKGHPVAWKYRDRL